MRRLQLPDEPRRRTTAPCRTSSPAAPVSVGALQEASGAYLSGWRWASRAAPNSDLKQQEQEQEEEEQELVDHHFALVTMLQRGLAEAGEAGVLRRFVAWGKALTHADACHEQAQYEMATFHPNTTLKDGGAIVNSCRRGRERPPRTFRRVTSRPPRPGDRLVITHPVTGKVATTASVFAADAASLSVATTVGLTDAGHRLEAPTSGR